MTAKSGKVALEKLNKMKEKFGESGKAELVPSGYEGLKNDILQLNEMLGKSISVLSDRLDEVIDRDIIPSDLSTFPEDPEYLSSPIMSFLQEVKRILENNIMKVETIRKQLVF